VLVIVRTILVTLGASFEDVRTLGAEDLAGSH
jgi:hypothetical protein